METLELTRIRSVKGTMSGGIGCVIRYSIDRISNPDFAECLYLKAVKAAMAYDIISLVATGQEQGEFISSVMLVDDEQKPAMSAIGGTYIIEPSYDLLRRIVRWKYNFSSDEAVTREDFREAYGSAFGDHFHSKWMSCDRNVEAMIAYFGDEIDNGQKFIGIVMKRVWQYEKRVNAKK